MLGTHHSRNINLVNSEFSTFHQECDVRQIHSCTEVEEHRQAVVNKVLCADRKYKDSVHSQSPIFLFYSVSLIFFSYCSGPARTVLMTPGGKENHPEEGHDEAEHRDEHHPSQRVWWIHVGWCHQNPHQTTKHLQAWGWRDDISLSDIYISSCLNHVNLPLWELFTWALRPSAAGGAESTTRLLQNSAQQRVKILKFGPLRSQWRLFLFFLQKVILDNHKPALFKDLQLKVAIWWVTGQSTDWDLIVCGETNHS